MTKQSSKVAYPNKNPISDNDYLGGTNGDTIKKETKSFQLSDLRNYLLQGLDPEIGGTLKITEIVYSGVLTTPEAVANQLNPLKIVLPYEIVIFNVNGDKYQLKLQDVTIGILQTAISSTDFIALSLVAENLAGGISTYKGYNDATGREEHYSIDSVGFSITKELDVDLNETGLILLEQIEQTHLGTGLKIYKGYNSTTKKQEFRTIKTESKGVGITIIDDIAIVAETINISASKINSNNLEIIKDVDGTININNVDSEALAFQVNNTYTGDDELGTITKPFKDIPQALVAYVGSGTNIAPENDGVQIKVQAGDPYNFTGNFVYKNLNIEFDGAIVNSTPSSGDWLLDKDSISDIDSTIKITLNNGARINLNKKGVKIKGNTISSPTLTKTVEILGDGTGTIYNVPDSIVVSPSTKTIFSVNYESTVGFNAFGVLTVHNVGLISPNAPIYMKGGSQFMSMFDCNIEYGTITLANINIETSPFIQVGGTITERGNVLTIYQVTGANINKLYRLSNTSSTLFQEDLKIQGGSFEYIFSNETGALYPRLDISNLRISNVVNTGFNDSSVIWDNVLIRNSALNICPIDYTKIRLTPSATNIINNQLVETLPEYSSKSSAVSAGLFKGCAFIKSTIVDADDLIAGVEYKITTAGLPSLGTVGDYFTATGSETGTGVGTLYQREIII